MKDVRINITKSDGSLCSLDPEIWPLPEALFEDVLRPCKLTGPKIKYIFLPALHPPPPDFLLLL